MKMSKSEQLERLLLNEKISQDFDKVYRKAVASPYIKKPIAYSLYQVWKQWDAKEEPREVEE